MNTQRSNNPSTFLTSEESAQVEAAIATAESRTSAEIKLVIARYCWTDIVKKAQDIFIKNKLDQTELRCGVLILLVTTNREFLIYGDKGIHEQVGESFWLETRDLMGQHFSQNDFSGGLCAGIEQIGEKLRTFFPWTEDDVNELSNEVAYEE